MVDAHYAKYLLDPDSTNVLAEGDITECISDAPIQKLEFKGQFVNIAVRPHIEMKIACTHVNKKLMDEINKTTLSGHTRKVLVISINDI
jgi:hypothetical protein